MYLALDDLYQGLRQKKRKKPKQTYLRELSRKSKWTMSRDRSIDQLEASWKRFGEGTKRAENPMSEVPGKTNAIRTSLELTFPHPERLLTIQTSSFPSIERERSSIFPPVVLPDFHFHFHSSFLFPFSFFSLIACLLVSRSLR